MDTKNLTQITREFPRKERQGASLFLGEAVRLHGKNRFIFVQEHRRQKAQRTKHNHMLHPSYESFLKDDSPTLLQFISAQNYVEKYIDTKTLGDSQYWELVFSYYLAKY